MGQMNKIALDILANEIDVISIQTAEINADRSGNIDMLTHMKERTGLSHGVFTTMTSDHSGTGSQFGTMILSKYPISLINEISLPNTSDSTNYALTHVRVNVNGTHVDYFNTHITAQAADKANQHAALGQATKDLK